MYYVIILTCLSQIFTKDCSQLAGDYTKIVAKNSEVIITPVSSFFLSSKIDDDLVLEDEDGKLSLIPPIQLTSSIDQPLQPPLTSFISFSVLMNDHQDWLNKFQLLGQRAENEQVLMSTKNYKPGTQTRSPVFDTFHILEPSTKTTYYSSAILDNNHLIIDCYSDDEGVQENFFYLIDETTTEKTKIPNNYPFQNQQRLQIQSTDKYIYRGTQKGRDSIIEIFKWDVTTKTVTLQKKIDEAFIKRFINFTDYQFDLVDFKAGKEDQVAILDKQGNIFIVQYLAENSDYSFYQYVYALGESISFDFDFNRYNYAVIQKNKMQTFFNRNIRTYQTTEDLTDSKAHIGKNFLFLTSSKKIIQFKLKLQIVSTLEGDFSLTLHDYNHNDFVVINVNTIKHYVLQDKFTIKYENPTLTSGSAKLTLNGCSVTIDYQNIERDSVQLVKVSKGEFINTPLFGGGYNKEVKPLHLVDGPKQIIQFQNQDGQKVDSIVYNSDFIITDETFKSTDIIFVQAISFDRAKDSAFQIVTQNKNLLITAYDCIQQPAWECTLLQKIQINIQLTNKNSKISNPYNELNIAVLVNSTKFVVHNIQYGGIYKQKSYQIDSELEIDSFYLSQFNIVFYSSTKKTLTVCFFEDMSVLQTISPEVMAKQGLTNWNPQKLFGNDLDEFFFVLNGDQQAIMFHLNYFDYCIIYIIDDLKISKDYLFMNFYERFALVQLFDDGNVECNVYNKQDLTNIFLEKQLSFYNYKISDLNDFFFDSYFGVVNVKAKSNDQDVVLTYLIDEKDHNALHTETIVNSTNKFLTCTINIIFFFDQNALNAMYIQTDPTVEYRVPEGDNTFVQNIKSNIVFFNEISLQIEQTFKLVNTQIEVKIKKNKLQLVNNLTSSQQDHYVQALGTEWYTGQITQFELNFPQNNEEITLIGPVEQIKQNYSQKTRDIADINSDYLFILKNDIIQSDQKRKMFVMMKIFNQLQSILILKQKPINQCTIVLLQ